jgi:aspartate/methionine/tyrosine aminotransferase
MKELTDTVSVNAFRQRFEAGRSFDLDDDLEFCPALLTESDVSVVPGVGVNLPCRALELNVDSMT